MSGKLDRDQGVELIQRLHKRFGENGSDPVYKVDTERTKHYFNEQDVDPPVIQGYEGHRRQWTGLRDTNTKLVARLNANPILPDVSAPRPGSTMEKQANDNELALLTMLDEWAEEDGVSPQQLLADAMGRMSAPALHWYLNDRVYDGLADLDYEEADDLPEDERERKRYTEDEYEEPIGKKKAKKYRETVDSYEERRAIQRAMCGSPWCVEVLESTRYAYLENPKALRRQSGLYKYFLKTAAIDLLDWQEGQKLDRDVLHGTPLPVDVQAGGQGDTWRPTATAEGKNLTFYQLWSKDWIYEYVTGIPDDSGIKDWRVVKNRQKYVPFALCGAVINLSNDHIHRYEPALASLFRKKPEYDRYISNRGILAETGAVAFYILQPLDDSLPPLTDEAGNLVQLTAHAAAAFKVPDGYKLERIGGDGAGADYVKYGEELRVELQEAMPGTGHSDIEGSTKPWTARLMQTEANVFPGMCLDHLLASYRIMLNNIADVNGSEDGPGDICFYPKNEDGKKSDAVVVIKPEQWPGLRYDAKVNKTSAVEQVTKMEHGRELLNDAMVGLTAVEFIEEYEGKPNPEAVWAKREAWKHVTPVVDKLFQQRVAAWAGAKFLITPDMRFGDATGRQVAPGEMLMSIGQQPTPQPQMPQQPMGAPIPAGGGGNGMVSPQVRMPSLPGAPPQGPASSVPGLVG